MRNIPFEREITSDVYLMPYPPRDTITQHHERRPFFGNCIEGLVGAEVGVFECNNAYFVCKYDKPKLLYLVDPYQKFYDIIGDLSLLSQDNWNDLFKLAQERMKHFPVEFIRKSSLGAAQQIPDESLDFCYIDGDHSYKSVAADIRAWLPKIKPGGLIGGHDFIEAEVKSAIYDFLVENSYTLDSGFNDWWFRK